jgi:hypothetical protein
MGPLKRWAGAAAERRACVGLTGCIWHHLRDFPSKKLEFSGREKYY